MIKTFRQIQRERRLRAHLRAANRETQGQRLPTPAPLPLLQQPGYSDLCNSPAFLVVFALALLILVLDLGSDQIGLQSLLALARWIGGTA